VKFIKDKKMRNDLTEIVVVMDRSGSMASCRNDAVGGLNSFIETQKKLIGDANFTLIQFDGKYEIVLDSVPIQKVGKCDLVPRGSTALLDAIGVAINTTGERLAKMSEKDRPGLVVIVIITDGEENSSKEFTSAQIKQMIDTQTNVYKWQFTYLGANQDAFQVGNGIGIQTCASYAPANTSKAFSAVDNNVRRMRGQTMSLEAVVNEYTKDEISKLS